MAMLISEPIATENGPAWLATFRDEARARFESVGLPTLRDEDWRYTRLDAIRSEEFSAAESVTLEERDVDPFAFGDLDVQRVVLVNGVFSRELSQFDGEVVGSLAEAMASESRMLEKYLTYFTEDADAFALLNSAMLVDGVFIHVGANVRVDRPIHLLNIAAPGNTPGNAPGNAPGNTPGNAPGSFTDCSGGDGRESTIAHHRCLVVAEAGSEVTVIEHYVALGGGVYFNNAVTQVFAKRDAKVEHYFIEQESDQAFNIQTLDIHQESGSNVTSHSALFGGALVRNNVHPVLDGEGAQCLINGLYVGGGSQHLDNAMRVVHAKPNGDSRQFYRGVLTDRAKAVFGGRIVVCKGADKTDAKQSNSNLLLSDKAVANTKPQLEIYADDVKCTHGATVGQIDEKAMFYLQSRGIDAVTARGMLVYAFAGESLDRMGLVPVRRVLGETLVEKMGLGGVRGMGEVRGR